MKATFKDRTIRELEGDFEGVIIHGDGDGRPREVEVVFEHDEQRIVRKYRPVAIEMLAEMLAEMRAKAGDKSDVCSQHGYKDNTFCNTCCDEREAVAGRFYCEPCSKKKGWRQYHAAGACPA